MSRCIVVVKNMICVLPLKFHLDSDYRPYQNNIIKKIGSKDGFQQHYLGFYIIRDILLKSIIHVIMFCFAK